VPFFHTQVVLFYDFEQAHFYPIFSLKQFFHGQVPLPLLLHRRHHHRHLPLLQLPPLRYLPLKRINGPLMNVRHWFPQRRISSFIQCHVEESMYDQPPSDDELQVGEERDDREDMDRDRDELVSTIHLQSCCVASMSDVSSLSYPSTTFTASSSPSHGEETVCQVKGLDIPFSLIEKEVSPTIDTIWTIPSGVGKGNCLRCRHDVCHNEKHGMGVARLKQRYGQDWPFPFPPQRPYYDPGCLVCRYGFCRKTRSFHSKRYSTDSMGQLQLLPPPMMSIDVSGVVSLSGAHRGRVVKRPHASYCYPCPGCEFRLTVASIRKHACRVIQCPHCYTVFHNMEDYDTHFTADPNESVYDFVCAICSKLCFNRDCFLKHRQLCSGRIQTLCVYCREPLKTTPQEQHVCKAYFCFSCQQKVQDPIRYDPLTKRSIRGLHECYINRPRQKYTGYAGLVMDLHNIRVFAFDFESRLDTIPGLSYPFDVDNTHSNSVLNPVYRHYVNCCSFMEVNVSRIVKHMIPADKMEYLLHGAKPDVISAYHHHIDHSSDDHSVVQLQSCFSLGAFWKAVVRFSTSLENYWYAHNMKAYDGRLLYDYLLSRNIYPIRMFWMGQKVMHLEYYGQKGHRIIFRDSACHIATSLSKLPGMFGLDPTIVKKGMFPYRLNEKKSVGYRGPFPSFEWFDTAHMNSKAFQEFRRWYVSMQERSLAFHDQYLEPLGYDSEGRSGWEHSEARTVIDRVWSTHHHEDRSFETVGVYDLMTEMVRYCENDVFVLSESLMKYTEVCCSFVFRSPLKYITVPQFTYQMYLQLYLPPKTICYLDINESRFARRALRGGNTNVRRLYYESVSDKDGVRYIDIQSLYPAVQFYDPMPVGRPQVRYFSSIDRRVQYLSQPDELYLKNGFFGFIECDLSIPHLESAPLPFHPALCLRGKIRQHLTLLSHYHPLERIVITSVELQAALSQGYKVTHVYRIDEYQTSHTLFHDFVSTWLKLKLLNSPIPESCSKAYYVSELNKRFRFRPSLRPSDFPDTPNVAMRGLAKLMLNSLWGKFGQRNDMISREILKHGSDVFRLNTQIQQGWVKQKKREFIRQSGGMTCPFQIADVVNYLKRETKNVAVAAFVTAHARLRLWKAMQLCGDKVVYHDTDSIVYEVQNEQKLVEEGLFLGDWESETGDALIYQFVSLAPKTYAYRYMTPEPQQGTPVQKEVVKGKGCSLNRENSCWIHFNAYAYLLCATFLRSPDPRVVAWFQHSVQSFPKLYRIAKKLFDRLDEATSVSCDECPLLQKQWTCRADTFLESSSSSSSSSCPSLPEQYSEQMEEDWDDIVQLYILRHLAIPSRMLLFKRLTDVGETVTFLLKKSFKFDYIKGEIDVSTFITYPFGCYQYMHSRFDYLARMAVFYRDHLVSLCSLYPTLSLKEMVVTGIGQLEYSPIMTGEDPDNPYEESNIPSSLTGVPLPTTTTPSPQAQPQPQPTTSTTPSISRTSLFFIDSESHYLTEGLERYVNQQQSLSSVERSQMSSVSNAWSVLPVSSGSSSFRYPDALDAL
jgi:hypothetical protein